MMSFTGPWLSEDEALHHRMESFHRQRVEAVASGQSPIGKRDSGFLVVHLMPRACVQSRTRFDGARLKEHGGKLSALGDEGHYPGARFNVDGLVNVGGGQASDSYTQVFRDGRIESVMSEVTFQTNGTYPQPEEKAANRPRYLRDTICERAVFKLVKEALSFCSGIGVLPPLTMFSALVGCKGVLFYSEWGRRYSQGGIERTPAYLPDIEIAALDSNLMKLLRPWCDSLFQACGLDGSPNFDEAGNWKERRR